MSGSAGECGTVWTVPVGNLLVWRAWDDEFLVYNTASGQAHHLNLLAGAALRSLEAEPGSASDLVCRLADQFEIAIYIFCVEARGFPPPIGLGQIFALLNFAG